MHSNCYLIVHNNGIKVSRSVDMQRKRPQYTVGRFITEKGSADLWCRYKLTSDGGFCTNTHTQTHITCHLYNYLDELSIKGIL